MEIVAAYYLLLPPGTGLPWLAATLNTMTRLRTTAMRFSAARAFSSAGEWRGGTSNGRTSVPPA